MSTIKRNGTLPSEPQERKRSELEERLSEMRKRSESATPASPPPLPNSPPPAETPPPPPAASHPAQRLDMLLGNNKPKTMESPSKNKKVSFMAEEVAVSKFEYNDDDIDDVVNSVDDEVEQHDDNDNNLSQENLENPHEDPNVSGAVTFSPETDLFYFPQAFISAAETLLSGQTLSKLEVSHVTATHTPSVIGTQEVYR